MAAVSVLATIWPVTLELDRIYTLIIVAFTIAVGLGVSIFMLIVGAIVKLTEDEMKRPPSRTATPIGMTIVRKPSVFFIRRSYRKTWDKP